MARNIAASIVTAMAQDVFTPIILVEFEFDSGNLYIWNGIGDTTIDSKTYTGAGDLLSLSEAEETSQVVARGMNVTLSGVPSALVALALNEPIQGRTCVVRWTAEGLSETSVLFSGKVDKIGLDEGGASSVIGMTVENDLAMLDRLISRSYTDQSQKSRYPNDEFFSHVTDLGEEIQWGGGL